MGYSHVHRKYCCLFSCSEEKQLHAVAANITFIVTNIKQIFILWVRYVDRAIAYNYNESYARL